MPPINELKKFGNRYWFKFGSKLLNNPMAINGKVSSFGIIKCLRSMKNMMMKKIDKIKKRRVVSDKPNK